MEDEIRARYAVLERGAVTAEALAVTLFTLESRAVCKELFGTFLNAFVSWRKGRRNVGKSDRWRHTCRSSSLVTTEAVYWLGFYGRGDQACSDSRQ